MYPPVNKHSNGKSPSWIGNTSSNGGFSIAMLDYRRVYLYIHVFIYWMIYQPAVADEISNKSIAKGWQIQQGWVDTMGGLKILWRSSWFLFGQRPKLRVSGEIPLATGHYKFTTLQVCWNLQVCAATCCSVYRAFTNLQFWNLQQDFQVYKSVPKKIIRMEGIQIPPTPELPKTLHSFLTTAFHKPKHDNSIQTD